MEILFIVNRSILKLNLEIQMYQFIYKQSFLLSLNFHIELAYLIQYSMNQLLELLLNKKDGE